MIDDTKTGELTNIPGVLRTINSELLPETVNLASLIAAECRIGPIETSENTERLIEQGDAAHHSACLFPVIVHELQKRRDQISSGKYLLLPPDWNKYTLIAGQYQSVLFSAAPSSRLVTEYLLLREALAYSVLDVKNFLLTRHPDTSLPTYTLQLLKVDAAARSSTIAHRIVEASIFLNIQDEPPYLRQWRDILSDAGTETVGQYRIALLKIKDQILRPPRKTIRIARLRTIYEMTTALASLSHDGYDPAIDLLRFVLNLRCTHEDVQHLLETYAARIQRQASLGVYSTSPEIQNALKCAAALADLLALETPNATTRSSDLQFALDDLPELNAVVEKGQSELSALIGSLQTYFQSDTTSPF